MIAAGGTAGHVVPALAVAQALRAEGAEVEFIGGDRAEARAGARRRLQAARDRRARPVPLEPIRGGRVPSGSPRPRLPTARSLLARIAPDAVMGGGGYVAGPGRGSPPSACASRWC